jgi:hypothetical protein
MEFHMPPNTILAATLEQMGIHFVAVQTDWQVEPVAPPDILLCGLASSHEARMRLALIPLFLKKPEYAVYVTEALRHLAPAPQQLLRCYYTAARLLQQKYRSQLITLFGNFPSLPALFEGALGLDDAESADIRLQQLAERQAQLSGRPINWYGTYEHAYTRLTRHVIQRMQWQ